MRHCIICLQHTCTYMEPKAMVSICCSVYVRNLPTVQGLWNHSEKQSNYPKCKDHSGIQNCFDFDLINGCRYKVSFVCLIALSESISLELQLFLQFPLQLLQSFQKKNCCGSTISAILSLETKSKNPTASDLCGSSPKATNSPITLTSSFSAHYGRLQT